MNVRQPFTALLAEHTRRYPALQLQDVYKLLHQGCLGSEHAVSDPAAARRWLQSELAGLGEGPPDPLLDPISGDGRILRLHLRPFLVAGGQPEDLLAAFLRTANEYHGSPKCLRDAWQVVERLARRGAVPFTLAAAAAFGREMAAQGFPAVHHSPLYVAAYRPAYRVIAGEHLSLALPQAGARL